MASESEAAEAAAGEGSGGSWSSISNWIQAEGSLEDSISFETSGEDAPATTSGGLLLRPPSDDPPSCEVTVCFREKHEIHRVYVRSTARVYEIYLSSEMQNNSAEYLCTVRCGPVVKVAELPIFAEQDVADRFSLNNEAIGNQQLTHNYSTKSDEDGWVEVSIPDSLQNGQNSSPSRKINGTSHTNIETHYEATADISDATPCVSLTLRLLSLQTKMAVHVEEIYIYADPIQPCNQDFSVSPAVNFGTNSFFTMLVPDLLQMSKSRFGMIQDNYFSCDSQHGVVKTAQGSSSTTERTGTEGADLMVNGPIFDTLQKQSITEQSDVHLGSSEKLKDHEADSCITNDKLGPVRKETMVNVATEEKNPNYNHVDKLLNELVSKVSKIESYCSRFEENMTKPLNCIETRLQRLEQQFNIFAVEIQSLKAPCLRMSVPELSCDISDSPNKGCKMRTAVEEATSEAPKFSTGDVNISSPESKMCLGLVVKAPDFSSDNEYDSPMETNNLSNFGQGLKMTTPSLVIKAHEFSCEGSAEELKAPELSDLPSPTDCVSHSMENTKMCPGMAGKKPEFSDENYELSHPVDNLETRATESFKHGKHLSIDGVMTSVLEAFVASARFISAESTANDSGITNPDSSFHYEGNDNISGESLLCDYASDTPLEIVNEADFSASLFCNTQAVSCVFLDKPILEENGHDESDAQKSGANFNSSLLASNMHSFASSYQSYPSFVTFAPEQTEVEIINCDDAADLDEPVCLKGWESVIRGASLPLAAFLSSRNINSSNEMSASDPAIKDSDIESDPPSSSLRVPRGGVDGSYKENNGSVIKDDIDMTQIFSYFVPQETSEPSQLERIDHEERSVEATIEGSIDGLALGNSFEQKGRCVTQYAASLIDALLAEKESFVRNASHHADDGSNGAERLWHSGCWLNESDCDYNGPKYIQLAGGWTEDSSSSSSYDENFIKNKADICLSDTSTTALAGASLHTSNFLLSTHNSVVSYKDQDLVASAKSDHEDPVWDVTFTAEREWRGNLPLEFLLGEAPTEVQSSVSEGGVDASATAGGLPGSSSLEMVCNSAMDLLLIDVENYPMATQMFPEGITGEQIMKT